MRYLPLALRAALAAAPLALLLAAAPAVAQEVYDVADEMPELVGGLAALQEHVTYPEAAREAGLEGRVLLQFVVDAEGDIVNPQVLRGADPLLDQAALDALMAVRFEPGRHEGEPVAVRMVLPVTFLLSEGEPMPDDGGGVGAATRVDQMPEIVGGLGAVVDRIVYPPEAEAEGVEGRVFVSFVVNESGGVEEVEVVSGVDPRLDAAALEAVRATTFRPGLQDGRPVRVRMVLPITFALPASGRG